MPEDTVALSYWKEVKKELDDVLMRLGDHTLVLHNSLGIEDLAEFFSKLPNHGKILYITFTKSFATLEPVLDEIKRDYFIVDCISKSLFEHVPPSDKCVYLDAPPLWEEISGLIFEYADKKKPSYIILDSLSQFIDFSSAMGSQKPLFMLCEHLVSVKRAFGSKTLLLYDDSQERLLRFLPTIYFNTVLRIEGTKKPRIRALDDDSKEWLPRLYESLFNEVKRLQEEEKYPGTKVPNENNNGKKKEKFTPQKGSLDNWEG